MNRVAFIAVAFASTAFFFSHSNAATIHGLAVEGPGSHGPVGHRSNTADSSSEDRTYFFVALSSISSGTTMADNASPNTGSEDTVLDIWLRFDPVTPHGHEVMTLDYKELDVVGAGNSNEFVETVRFDGGTDHQTATTRNQTESDVSLANPTRHILDIGLGAAKSRTMSAKLQSESTAAILDGDTVESLVASVQPVPLPAAAWFILTALGGLVGARWLTRRTEVRPTTA